MILKKKIENICCYLLFERIIRMNTKAIIMIISKINYIADASIVR